MTTVYFKHKERFGTSLTLPHVGHVSVSNEGTFDVADETKAKALCEQLPALCTLDEETQDVPTMPAGLKTKKDFESMLKGMTMKQLKELAEAEPSLDQKWKMMQKNPLISFLATALFKAQGDGTPEVQTPVRKVETQIIEDDDEDPDVKAPVKK